MKPLRLMLLLALLAACSDMPDEPNPYASRYKLTVLSQPETIWSGDSVCFTVTSGTPPPQGCAYQWSYEEGGRYQVRQTVEPAITLLVEYGNGSVDIGVSVMTNGVMDDRYQYGRGSFLVQKTTGIFTMKPDTALWDATVPFPLSVSFGGRIANDAMVHWSFGDGAELTAAPSDIVRHIFTSPGVYATTATLKRTGNDSVIATATGHIEVGPLTPGRFLTFTIVGLERTYRREYTSSSGQTSYSNVTKSDTITGSSAEFLRWEGDVFTLESDQVLGSNYLRSCAGLLGGDEVDTVRIASRIGGILDGHSISMKLRDIPRISEHQWMQSGPSCANSLAEYADIGSVWGGVRMPGDTSPRSSTRYLLKSWRFLENARIEITISHDRPD